MPKAIRDPSRMYICPWCDERKTAAQMRYPGILKGIAPPTCAECRESHPDQSWCAFHEKPHPVERFRLYGGDRPGYYYICKDASAIQAAQKRNRPPRVCASCRGTYESWFFRGGRAKQSVCRACEDQHPTERWCLGCDGWLPRSAFTLMADGRYAAARCVPCRAAYAHGTTVATILRIQGSVRPECGACGSTRELKVDHDHACCPASVSNGCCIRGYLCHECNSAEGLLKTARRARQLARYMDRWEKMPSRPEPRARLGVARAGDNATAHAHAVQRGLW